MQVFALVGQSGSGKSHRASLLANELDIDLIVDDGLVIRDGKILAGTSAKREPSRLAAVRRAIFADASHAEKVKQCVNEIQPERLLVLGTSRTMVNRITEALDLPLPEQYIDIRDIASQDEIRRAIKIRKEQGKHVIPAPTLEVKKTFSGYLVDPLRFLLPKRTSQTDDLVIEKSVVRPTWSSLGKFFIADSVVGAIAVKSCRDVAGIARVRKVVVSSTEEGVEIDLDVWLLQGCRPFTVLETAQQQVRDMVEHCTALHVISTDVSAKRIILEA